MGLAREWLRWRTRWWRKPRRRLAALEGLPGWRRRCSGKGRTGHGDVARRL